MSLSKSEYSDWFNLWLWLVYVKGWTRYQNPPWDRFYTLDKFMDFVREELA